MHASLHSGLNQAPPSLERSMMKIPPLAAVLAVLTSLSMAGCFRTGAQEEKTAVASKAIVEQQVASKPLSKFEETVRLGQEASKRGDVDLAWAYAETAVRLEPTRAEGFALRGATHSLK